MRGRESFVGLSILLVYVGMPLRFKDFKILRGATAIRSFLLAFGENLFGQAGQFEPYSFFALSKADEG